jgi:hypothetical protein
MIEYHAELPPITEYRPVPGAARYVMGADRSVWTGRYSGEWGRLKPRMKGGVLIVSIRPRRGDREACRSIAKLYAAVFPELTDAISEGPARGSRHGRAILDEDQVLILRQLFVDGWSARKLSVLFGVSQTSAQKIVRGETWTHVAVIARPGNDFDPVAQENVTKGFFATLDTHRKAKASTAE